MKKFGKLFLFLFVLISALATVVRGWEELDFEIFELWDSIKINDETTDWYNLIGVKENASVDEINRAFRSLSRRHHPDKLQGSSKKIKKANEKFARLTSVVNILRDSYKRKRYNFFRKNGVPVWRGTGYLYRRWRPGTITVLIGLGIFFSLTQYMFMSLSYWRAQQRIKEFEEHQQKMRSKSKKGTPSLSSAQLAQNRSRMESPFNEEEDVDYVRGGIDPYSVEPASVKNLLFVKIFTVTIDKFISAAGIKSSTPAGSKNNQNDAKQSDFDTENESNISKKKNKGKNSTNVSDIESKNGSVATSDVEFNAMVVKKSNVIAAMNQESLDGKSTSVASKKKAKKRRGGPIV
ncbi:hypothetical protein BB560_004831 [Smittium megazygosporum]|uniref:J domain-containing protein n=2 Tax=Smittium megazygosporum TaxID=133381 RepID=A0A2T9Z8A5_9FUNG|nr:hypothetical protein BB560_004831 [Smittium megazygosporum]